MKNHVFLIIAHNNPQYLFNLVRWLNAPNHFFVVHIDKKSVGMLNSDAIKNLQMLDNVDVFSEYSANWGGQNMILCTIEVLKRAKEKFPSFDWVHLISGSHIPLKSNADFDSVFEDTKYMGFMGGVNLSEQSMKRLVEERMCLYYFNDFHNRRSHDLLGIAMRVVESVEKFFFRCGVRFRKPLNMKYEKGANWFLWNCDLVNYVLEFVKANNWYVDRFRYTSCCDEVFFHIILANSPYWDKICKKNLLYVDWTHLDPDEKSLPHTLHAGDYERIKQNTDCVFARKVDPVKSKELIEKIVQSLS